MTFNREPEPGLVHVIGFQGSQSGGKFTVNLGIYVREIDVMFDDWWGRRGKAGEPGRDGAVREEVCWLRARLGRLGPEGDREDKWWGYEEPAAAAADVRDRFLYHAEPAFAQAKNRAALLSQWDRRQSSPGSKTNWLWRSERRAPLGYAVLLKATGRVDDARRVVDEVSARSIGTPFHSVVEGFAEDLGLASAE